MIEYFTRVHPARYSRETMVERFIKNNMVHFDNPANSFYKQQDKARAYLDYWVKNDKFGPDYNDHFLIKIDTMFSEFMEMYQDADKT